jgi:hypothetical protein
MLEEIPQIIKDNYEEDDTLEDLKKKAKILSFSTFNGKVRPWKQGTWIQPVNISVKQFYSPSLNHIWFTKQYCL